MSTKKREMRVCVTARDIREGKKGDGDSCPVARALRRALKRNGGYEACSMAIRTAHVKRKGEYKMVQVPEKVSAFIRSFDRSRRGAKPFTFTLRGWS